MGEAGEAQRWLRTNNDNILNINNNDEDDHNNENNNNDHIKKQHKQQQKRKQQQQQQCRMVGAQIRAPQLVTVYCTARVRSPSVFG